MNEDWKARSELLQVKRAAESVITDAQTEQQMAEAELERVQRQCAAMREALRQEKADFDALIARGDFADDDIPHAERTRDKMGAALKGDAGRDFFTREQVMPLVEALEYYANTYPAAGGKSRAQVALAHAKSIGLLP